MQAVEQAWFSISDAAKYLGTSRNEIYRFVEGGFLKPYYRPGGERKWFKRQDLDNLNLDGKIPESLQLVDGIKEYPFPHPVTGIYFLVKKDKVVYVGQSIDIGTRLGRHEKDDWKDYDQVFFVSAPKNKLREMESHFIEHFAPKYNDNMRR